MSIKDHRNFKTFFEDSISSILFEDQDYLYEVCCSPSRGYNLRKMTVKRAHNLLNAMPALNDSDDEWEKYSEKWGETWSKTVPMLTL